MQINDVQFTKIHNFSSQNFLSKTYNDLIFANIFKSRNDYLTDCNCQLSINRAIFQRT